MPTKNEEYKSSKENEIFELDENKEPVEEKSHIEETTREPSPRPVRVEVVKAEDMFEGQSAKRRKVENSSVDAQGFEAQMVKSVSTSIMTQKTHAR